MPLLILLFIALPIAELWVIIEVGGAIGVGPTLALVIFGGIVGAMLARSQGRAAWTRFQLALAEGRMPGREVFDGAAIIFGGALLLTPGFITDGVGLALLLPPSRAALRSLLARSIARRSTLVWRVGSFGTHRGPGFEQSPGGPSRPRRPSYDYEGSASEVREPPGELPDRGAGESQHG